MPRCYSKVILVVAVSLCLSGAHAQQAPAVTSVGYSWPFPIRVAPGQIVTLFVSGVAGRRASAQTLPLPTELAGVSVVLRQGLPVREIPVPILQVADIGFPRSAVTVQIPYEMRVSIFVDSPNPLPAVGFTELVVTSNGVSGPRIGNFLAIGDSIHVVTDCTLFLADSPDRFDAVLCLPAVTHADGTRVHPERPARPGEILVMYALGLGLGLDPVPRGLSSGSATPAALPLDPERWTLDFNFNANAAPRVFQMGLRQPVYVGLVPGFVGLYQVNFRVPADVPRDLPRCGEGLVFTNLTVTLIGHTSFDGARFCIEVP